MPDELGLKPWKLIDLCGMAGGADSQEEAEYELRERGFDPDLVLQPDPEIAQEFLADGMAHTTIAREQSDV